MCVDENRPSKIKLFMCQGIRFRNLEFKNGLKNEFNENNRKYSADPGIGFPKMHISKPFGFTSSLRQHGS